MSHLRLPRPSDPTFLAIGSGLCASYCIIAPWQRQWIYTPTEEPWMYLVLPQAVAAALLRPRSHLAWAALAMGLLLCFPRTTSPQGAALPWAWRVMESLSAAGREPAVARVVFWAVAVVACGMAVRAFTQIDCGGAVATATVGLIGSLVVSEAILWLREVFPPRTKSAANLIEVVVYLLPAVALPALLWRRWPRIVLWIGTPLAAVALSAILILDQPRTSAGLAAIKAVLIGTAGVWAYVDWRRSRQEETGRGFEVLVAPT